MYLTENFGWVFIYIFAFGISDLFVQRFIKDDVTKVAYFSAIGLAGITMVFCKMRSGREVRDGIGSRATE